MELFACFMIFVGAVLFFCLALQVCFILTVTRALNQCAPHNRTMEPAMAWLNLIPLFNLVWMFITVIKVAESLENEYDERGMHRRNENYGHDLGIAMCLSPLLGLVPFIVVTIVYWLKMAEYSRRLERTSSRGRDDYDDYDDEDDRDERRERRGRSGGSRRDRDDDDDRRESRPWDRGR